ncbi:RING U-box superfamily isoform 1 [Olea europaea subsp. europaea]|uniref:RING U-box superfamily isoform 1 n=2 Tax=Olea europaea subsp. europaea TaxID=158383 RepID=A0A8S0T494_OLEEU|nr:RING U-box superfamily isoform 1 [Olea europaea subsp. europaea]
MSAADEIVGRQLVNGLQGFSIQGQCEMKGTCTAVPEEINHVVTETNNTNNTNHHGFCAICLNKIVLEETALIKGCEHAYCVTCILRWASYKKEPTCPQCKNSFKFLNIHRSLDGSIHDYMFEESVCLLLRASWFKPLIVVEREEAYEEIEDYYREDEEEDDDIYLASSSSLRIGNRRWGDNGYVRAGRKEARPIARPNFQDSGAGPSRQRKKKEAADSEAATAVAKETVGRRAKRALKREAADKAAAAKHQQHLVRLGRT